MSDLPAPMTPPDCDLRGLTFMPLDVVRLGDSDLFAISTGAEFKAAVALWCKAWLQVPAASLPNDERVLAHLSGAGPQWRRVRDVALRGWVLCSDGRLYHPVIAEKAIAAFSARIKRRVAVSSFHEKRKKEAQASEKTENHEVDNGGAPLQGRGRGTVKKEEDSSLRSESVAADPPRQGSLLAVLPGGAPKPPKVDLNAAFDAWWSRYPLKVKKPKAKDAYLAAIRRGATPDDLAAGLARAVWPADPSYIPHPTSWLNQGRWQDQAPPRLVHDAPNTNHSGASNEQFGRPSERRTYGAGGSDEIREAVIAAVPGLASRLAGD